MPATQATRAPGAEQGSVAPDPDASTHQMLELIVTMAVITEPSTAAASVTLAYDGGGEPSTVLTVATTRKLAKELDALQHRHGRGPAVDAVRSGHEARCLLPSPDLRELSDAAGQVRVCSAWSLPLLRAGRSVGSLNLYSSADPPWQGGSEVTARVAATLAELTLSAGSSAARLARGNATLREALETRTLIGQAQGILMARQDIQAGEAFDILRRGSQRTNRKLRELAAEIVAGVGRSSPAPESGGRDHHDRTEPRPAGSGTYLLRGVAPEAGADSQEVGG